MHIDFIKIWLFNGTTLFISMQDINNYVKFILLILSIGYTLVKWYNLIMEDPYIFPEKKDKDENGKN